MLHINKSTNKFTNGTWKNNVDSKKIIKHFPQ